MSRAVVGPAGWSVQNPPSPRTTGIAVRAYLLTCAAAGAIVAAAAACAAIAVVDVLRTNWPTGGAR
jgi:hypothetical protein